MKFLTRDEYLDLRLRWKKIYLRVSKDIHALKVATKMAAKGGYEAANNLQSLRMRMSNHAYDLMLNLDDLKEASRFSVAVQRVLDNTNQDWN